MPEFIRPVIARVAGWIIATLVTWLASRYGIIVPQETVDKLTAYGVIALMSMFTAIYALVHRAVSIKSNPTDAASPRLSEKKQ